MGGDEEAGGNKGAGNNEEADDNEAGGKEDAGDNEEPGGTRRAAAHRQVAHRRRDNAGVSVSAHADEQAAVVQELELIDGVVVVTARQVRDEHCGDRRRGGRDGVVDLRARTHVLWGRSGGGMAANAIPGQQ